jgi:hypothetical protein
MTTTPCPFEHLDGAYVLGSLAPAERADYERHLAGCAECSRSVRELAGLPGLLARVSPDVLEQPGSPEPVPETLLPALVAAAGRDQRVRVLRAAGLAAAAAAVVVGGSAAVLGAVDDDGGTAAGPSPTVAASTSPARPMQQLGDEVTGSLSLTTVAWGTRLDLDCSYAAEDYVETAPETYALFVRADDGDVERVATWRSVPGREMRLSAATATDAAEIRSVVVRTGEGQPVLRLTP